MRIRNLITGASLACLFATTFCVLAQPAAEKLARPTPQQAAWHDCEIGMFIHFGPATWQDSEYDTLGTPLGKINAEKLDTDQWVAAAEAMGAKYVVFVAKHTGGFCWWQTETTDYGVRNIPWRGGKGDVMKDLAESCRKRGIKLGVYLSPQDDKFGAGGGGRCKTPEAQERYDKVFRQQLTELLSRYGEMFEVWFDGSSITDVGDLLKQYCPKAMVFQGPYATIRWVGNEDGVAPYPNWNALPLARAKSGVSTGTDGNPDGDAWMPNECDARIRSTWFWNSKNADTLKSVDQLMSMYYQSVGRGAVLLLNIAPDTTGLMPGADVKRAAEFGAEIRRRFGKNIAETSGKGELVELDLGKLTRIDHVVTMENIVQGERVREYVIEGLVSGQWQELCRGTSIGHKKIDQFAPTEVSQVRLRVLKSAAEPQIRKLAVYRVAGVEVRLLKDYDPAGGKISIYDEPQTDWKRLRIEDFQLNGARVRIIAPEKPLPGNPWLLDRGAWEPLQVARALLEKGVYFIDMEADDFGSSQAVARWNALYAELTEKRGFSKKVVLEGVSRSGLGVYNWAAENPEKVACIYVEAPVLNIQSWPGGKGKGPGWPEGWKELQRLYGFKSEAEAVAYAKNPVDKASILAMANVPIIHVCGDSDKVVPYEENTGLFKERYEKAGGRNMTIILKGGMGHWTHGLKDPTPVVDFILRAIQESAAANPATTKAAEKIWKWSAETVGKEWKTVDIDLTAFCKDACVYQVDFTAAEGKQPLEIQSLTLLMDGIALPEFTKPVEKSLRYHVTITGLGKPLTLRAVVRVSGEKKDSQGTVTLRKGQIAGGVEAAAPDADTCLLFATFHGNGEDGLHLVWSDDGMNWKVIQDDKSFLQPAVGARIMRDPSLIRSPDGVFHMVWTSGWWEKGIGYASSKDFIHWSKQVAIPVMAHEPRAEMCWAPEIRYEEQAKEYLIYWSSSLNGETATPAGQHGPRYFRTYATTTTDFNTFSPTRLFFDPQTPKGEKGEGGQIDSSTVKMSDKYYIFYKEGYNPGGIRYASADKLQGPYEKIFAMFAQDNSDPNDENYIIWEGPTAIRIGDYCIVYMDRGKKKNPSDRMGAWRSEDMIHWEDISQQTHFPPWTQHGSVLRVPRSVVRSLSTASNHSTMTVKPAAPPKAQPFSLHDVQLLDGPFKDAQDIAAKYLLSLEPDRLLADFRKEAGLQPKAQHYGGWESTINAGHTAGHYLSACSLAYASTRDRRFLDRVGYIVDELAECQNKNGDGYVAAIPGAKEKFAEISKGNVRLTGQGNFLNGLNDLSVPVYIMHKLFAGLRDAYRLCDNAKALEVEKKFGGWLEKTFGSLNEEQMQKVLACEHGGINETLAELYADTGDERFLKLARRFHHQAILDPLAQGKDILPGKHANTQIPKLIGLAVRYELDGDPRDRAAADFFWDRVAHHHSYVTGGNSNLEHFGPPDQLNDRLSAGTTETCNVCNMLKLTTHVFGWNPSGHVADFYERALLNHIRATQHPDGRVIYNLSLQPGHYKEYQSLYDAFTCCVGTGMENHVKYGEGIYFHDKAGLWINLYVASELQWKARNVVLRQETRWPDAETSTFTFTFDKPQEFTLRLRHPHWAKDGIRISVNGAPQSVTTKPSTYAEIRRVWRSGDRVQISFPMSIRTESMPDNPKRIAFFYGPTLLAADLGPVDDPTAKNPDYVPVIGMGDKSLADAVKPLPSRSCAFKTSGIGKPRDVELVPFWRLHDRRYTVYFEMKAHATHSSATPFLAGPAMSSALSPAASVAQPVVLSLDPTRTVNRIDEKIYGHFLEHIYRSCNGGLWGDLVWNRSFEHNAADGSASHNWTAYGPGKVKLVGDKPLNSRFCQWIVAESGETGLQQTPVHIRQGETYRGSLWARGEAAEGLVVRLRDGSQTLAEVTLPCPSAEWKEYPFEFKPTRGADNAKLQIGVRGKAELWLDQVSMMPESWAKAGGFRPDLVQAVADLRPPVIRWPGGCYACWYRWKDGIGPQHKRQASAVEAWEDHDVNSLGTDEFMALCRKVGAEPLIVVNIGFHEWFRRDYPNVTADELVQDILDWIEYCNGPADSKWGKVRAATGHPEPYNVKYWEIDNEAWIMGAEGYANTVRKIAPLMKKADPSIQVVAVGAADYVLPWNKFIIDHCAELIDYLSLHHYENPNGYADGPRSYEDFFQKTGELIRQSKNPKLKIYVSEWSVQTTDWRTGLYAGGLLNSFERCGDFLAMGGPALFLRHAATISQEWKAFINFDHRTWFPAPNYVVMKLWHDHYAPARVELDGDGRRLNAVATKSADGRTLYFKAVNPSDQSLAIALTVKEGFRIGTATMLQVAPGSLESGNTLDRPDAIKPMEATVNVSGQELRFALPRWSAGVVTINPPAKPREESSLVTVAVNDNQNSPPPPETFAREYHKMRGGLDNCRLRFEREKVGRVAFLGGSITEGGAWRDLVCQELRKRFPDTQFDFINAGIASMDSTPGAFRFSRDVLKNGPVDLLFEEAAVNDQYNGRSDIEQIRGMEGIVRQALLANPAMDIVLLQFVDPPKMEIINRGQVPSVIANHERIAARYNLPSIDLAMEVTERIRAGEFTWEKDFRDLHPSPFGHQLYARSISRLLDAAWKNPSPAGAEILDHKLPEPVDDKSYFHARLVSLAEAKIENGWKLTPNWVAADGAATRPGFVNVPMLVATEPGATLRLRFHGTAVGIFVAAGPDAGIVEYSIDGAPVRHRDLFTEWSGGLHLPWAQVLEADLEEGPHVLVLRPAAGKNPASKGHAVRIAHFLVNGDDVAQPAAEKLARPTPQQAAWHDCEIGMFICLDPCTWQDREYDNQSTPLEKINAEKLDTDQWVAAAEAMGAKYVVFVAKHTGGFCWWQTETTDYGVRNIPWRGGKGDVMKDLAASCRQRGIKLGVYLSPQDDKFGAGGGGRCKTPEAQQRYDKVFRQQLTELLSRYGEMFEVWFDGSSITDVGDILKQYCPKAMVFQGPYATIRWVGNEDGVAPYPNWNSLPLARARSGVSTGTDGNPDGDAWMPNECDARIRSTWFWNSHNADTLKSVDQLMSMYYQSVGRGAVLLLNMTPDTTGLMPEADVKRAAEFGAEIRRRFGKSIGETSGKGELVELDLGRPTRLDHVIMMENIVEGERVREYVIEGMVSGQWQGLCRGTSIGHKKIDQFAPTEVSQVRLRVLKSAAKPLVQKLAAYCVSEGIESTPLISHAQRKNTWYLWTSHAWDNDRLGLHYAVSSNGLDWKAIKNDKSIFQPSKWIFRDPAIARDESGTFHLLWTVAWNSSEIKAVGYAQSKDLVHWDKERYLPVMENEPETQYVWAPELFWDSKSKDWIITWGSTVRGKFAETAHIGGNEVNGRIYYKRTKDFAHFTPSTLLFDPHCLANDQSNIYEQDGSYYIFFKADRDAVKPVNGDNIEGGILYVKGSSPVGPFTLHSDMINKYREKREDRLIEGPEIMKVEQDVIMYYGSGDYSGAFKTSDMKTWVRITDQMTLPKRYMHGTVIEITEEEARTLLAQ